MIAVWSEYDAVIFLLALTAAALWVGVEHRRRDALLGVLPIRDPIPWIRSFDAQHRQQDQALARRLEPVVLGLKEATITLAFGENGGLHADAARWLELVLIVAALVAVASVLRR